MSNATPDVRSMDDHALLIEIMTSDGAINEDGSDEAVARQHAAADEGDRRWGTDALERSAEYFVAGKFDSEDIVRFATENPDGLFRIMGVTAS